MPGPRLGRLIGPVLAAAVVAGCGGGSDKPPFVPLNERPVDYRGGFYICSVGEVKYVAQRYGVHEATPEAVADAVAAAIAGGSSSAARLARQGCLDALAAQADRKPGQDAP
jgi:hypothetical protein